MDTMLQPLTLSMRTRNLAVPVRFQQITIDPQTFIEFAEGQRKLKRISSTLDAETQAKKDAEILQADSAQIATSVLNIVSSYQGNARKMTRGMFFDV